KKLIIAMGAEFTVNMSSTNTIVVAAHQTGSSSSLTTWLEDYFVQWHALSVGLAKYITFPLGVVKRRKETLEVQPEPEPEPGEDEDDEPVERPKSRLVRRADSRKELALQKAREELEEAGPFSKPKSKSASKSKPTPTPEAKTKARGVSDDPEVDSEVVVVSISKTKSVSKGKTKAPPPVDLEEEKEEIVPKPKRQEPVESSREEEAEVVIPKTKSA
ncbi:hypothetical protein FIBSPDRAFT_725022, partial [Athelia psychrophila]